MATGVFQLLSVAVWYFNRNFVELQVPYESMSDEVILKTKFGIDFYLVFGNAIFCISLGLVIYALNALYPDTMCGFFGIDPLSLYDEYHLSKTPNHIFEGSRYDIYVNLNNEFRPLQRKMNWLREGKQRRKISRMRPTPIKWNVEVLKN